MAGDVGGGDEGGEGCRTEPSHLDKLFIPVHLRHVEEERALGLDAVGGGVAGEEVAHVVLHEEDMAGAGEDVGLVRLEPHHLGERPGGSGHLVGGLEYLVAHRLAELGAFCDGALVGPHDRAADGAVGVVHQHRVVGGAVERGGGDVREVNALIPQLAQCGAERVPPVLRLLL